MSDTSRLLSTEQLKECMRDPLGYWGDIEDHLEALESQLTAERAAHQETREALETVQRFTKLERDSLLAQQRTDQQTIAELRRYIHTLTVWMAEKYPAIPEWKPLDDALGMLTQIDNMAVGFVQQCDALAATLAETRKSSYGFNEIARLRKELSSQAEEVGELRAKLRGVREMVERMPHQMGCGRIYDSPSSLRFTKGPCDCWKRDVLALLDAPEPPTQTEEK